ncbi:CRISPR-associated endonuclease Csn1 [Breznakibacter xylanolyticus]|uniref:CRISPR-associated endonuclease Cas9 n=1 Tax=Breznakibacter xylanolyticus TaxID=990 RepID=A0A2W7N4L8_9BACT|nr:type II CRISPR RNA-guided endonuclease Cas9 [Breznakibacter xylanolyticus]PZX11794.1 CRISPR-associated endonuclease Csn1 [Breznakibacter xylanolyticus]
MKKILGLDLGTNSIGWALVDHEETKIDGIGSRIIPMDEATIGDFNSGNAKSQTSERTRLRSMRRLNERFVLRRERLLRVLKLLNFLPTHYAEAIDFSIRKGKFKENQEPKIQYKRTENGEHEFLFMNSFNEMLKEFQLYQPQLLNDGNKIPYDWTIYYLRKKALREKIKKEELAWLLLQFNQKRGYYQARGEEEEEKEGKLVEYHALKVVDVVADEQRKGKDEVWYSVKLENGWIYRRSSKVPLFEWTGKVKEFIVTTEVNEDGSVKKDKEGNERRSFRAPKEDDWGLMKKKTEADIERVGKTVGEYIYETLLLSPDQKIKGKLVRTIERKFYKEELSQILKTQIQLHDELQDRELYVQCLNELYQFNEAHKNSIADKDFLHLLVNDVLFYQRPLKSKKSLIANCPYEVRTYKKEGQKLTSPIKCIAKSNPLFQEFRLWQFMQNLRIYSRDEVVNGKQETDVDVTERFFPDEAAWVELFDWLSERKEVDQKAFLKYPKFGLKKDVSKYRWNYVEDKLYPCNETRGAILSKLKSCSSVPNGFLTPDVEMELWHLLYSVDDKQELVKALTSFAIRYQLGDDFVEQFKKFPPFKKDYGAYSEKAIKKLLPLMRMGKYWCEDAVDANAKYRLHAVNERLSTLTTNTTIEDIADDDIPKQVIKSFQKCKYPLRGFNTYQACYAVYGRHSESVDAQKWQTPADIDKFLANFKQHSLRNPIVEQVVGETLRVVRDIWQCYGDGKPNFFDEIHIELGREMKNPADKRKRMTSQITENENTNLRIKALLAELLNDKAIEEVRPYSPSQQEILKIYEEGALMSVSEIPDDILKISKLNQPTKSELVRYKLWLDQKYRSPYTGEVIPLSKLFTSDYQIEHVIPQSRYFDDSLSNKVICEAEVNADKDNNTAFEYIKNNQGKIIELNYGKKVTIMSMEGYGQFVKQYFGQNPAKMKKLLMEDIPEDFINRQLNDSRYISKYIKGLLSNIVREEGEMEATTKRVVSSNGSITTVLKQDWGLNDVWNDIVAPRFIRLNELTNSTNFGQWVNKGGKQVFQTQMPLELQKGFNKKRIDHRHHAMDALVIACATRDHVNYLNNEYAKASAKETRFDLRRKLRRIEPKEIVKKINGETVRKKIDVAKEFYKPWPTFTQDAREALETTIVSFKQNLRVINRAVNKYQRWQPDGEGKMKKVTVSQTGTNWAIRKAMHKDTVSGVVTLKKKKAVSLSVAIDMALIDVNVIVDKTLKQVLRGLIAKHPDKKAIAKYFKDNDSQVGGVDVSKVEVYYADGSLAASRVAVDDSFDSRTILDCITDTAIQKIMLKHLDRYNTVENGKTKEHPELAFSPEGIDQMNKDIVKLNGGRFHKPIYKVRKYEPVGNKFVVGHKGNKSAKFVEAAKGTNLFFAIYKNEETGKRSYETIPFYKVVEIEKQNAKLIKSGTAKRAELAPVPLVNEAGDRLLFYLSPNDLVYIPEDEECDSSVVIGNEGLTKEQCLRVYKFVSCTGNEGHFVPNFYSSPVLKNEVGANNKSQNTIDGRYQIKSNCLKLRVSRLGQVIID